MRAALACCIVFLCLHGVQEEGPHASTDTHAHTDGSLQGSVPAFIFQGGCRACCSACGDGSWWLKIGIQLELANAGDPEPLPPWLRLTGYEMLVTAETVSKFHVAQAVEALGHLVQTQSCVSTSLFYAVLKKCSGKKDLVLGRRVHALTVKMGYQSDTFLCNHILRMYASSGRLQDAMDVFSVVDRPDAFMWSSIISAHVELGQDKRAIQLYHRMRMSSAKPDGHVFVAALQACARGSDLETGQQVHAHVLATGVEPDLFVCSCLVDMYAKCGSLRDAQGVFDGISRKNVVLWNTMIAGYSQRGMGSAALGLYKAMQEEGIVAPDSVTFVCLLQACASLGTEALENGKQLHVHVTERGHQSDVFVASSLVNMYAKCGSLEDAQRVFDGLVQKDVVTWNAMIAGYCQQGMGQEALHLYGSMHKDGFAIADSITFVCALQACAIIGAPALKKGKQLHTQIKERGHEGDVNVANSLVNMYAKCGSLPAAQRVFDGLSQKDVVTWNAMIAGYSQQGMGQEALSLYSVMQEEDTAEPDSVTFVSLLQACASLGTLALAEGKHLHVQIMQQGHGAHVFVANSLVNMYAKCGSLEDAQRVFDELGQKDVVAWNAMIAGYSQQGMGQEALHLYSVMQEDSLAVPDSVTFMCLLQACANVAALDLGRQLHAQIQELGLQADVFVAGCLINMYGRSGSMAEAQQVFDALRVKDVAAWNALIAGYSYEGDSQAVFHLIENMREDGMQPVGITFLSVLTVCSHLGLVDQGMEYFEAMSRRYGVTPTVEHYTCTVDLLGRAGRLNEALDLVKRMLVPPNADVWHALLAACRKWSNIEVGCHAFNEAVKLDKKDAAAYVLMWNIYTGAQMWEQAENMQVKRKRIRAWKRPGQSWWTDMNGLVHTFLAGITKHSKNGGR